MDDLADEDPVLEVAPEVDWNEELVKGAQGFVM